MRTIVGMFIILLLLLSGIASASTATYSGRTVTIYNDAGHKCSTWTSPYTINDLDIANNVMYVSTSKMLKSVSISTPVYPVGVQSISGNFKQAVIKNNILYTIQDGKVTVYNVKDKKPIYVTVYSYKSPAKIMEISGKKLYVLYIDGTKNIYNILSDGKLQLLPRGV